MDFRDGYYKLFNSITTVIRVLEQQVDELQKVQVEVEEMYLDENEMPIMIIPKIDTDEGESF